MTVLVVDVRNSFSSIGVFEGEELVDRWRVASNPTRTADEWHVLITGLVGHGEFEAIGVSCTVPAIMTEIRSLLARHFSSVKTAIVEPGTKTGVPIHTDNPKEVGADRIVNAVAAKSLFGGPAIVVDFGTATIFDVVNAEGNFIGGVISPGIEVSLEALTSKGAQLRSVEPVAPSQTIGKNTVEAMQSGIVFGMAGLVDGIIDRILSELDEPLAPVIATGYAAESVWKECETVTHFEPDLTLIGLRLIVEKN